METARWVSFHFGGSLVKMEILTGQSVRRNFDLEFCFLRLALMIFIHLEFCMNLALNSEDTKYSGNSSPIILQNLVLIKRQVLPYKLEHLCLILLFNINDLIIFLKNSQNTFIEKLLIGNIINIIQNGKSENISYYVKEYIMKKERVRYLAFLETDHKNYEEDDDEGNDEELFF
ncbi:unnamed protein product [Rhizophagus irregularis]|nr:unnamed protein product [Rhizophagus irregularis]